MLIGKWYRIEIFREWYQEKRNENKEISIRLTESAHYITIINGICCNKESTGKQIFKRNR